MLARCNRVLALHTEGRFAFKYTCTVERHWDPSCAPCMYRKTQVYSPCRACLHCAWTIKRSITESVQQRWCKKYTCIGYYLDYMIHLLHFHHLCNFWLTFKSESYTRSHHHNFLILDIHYTFHVLLWYEKYVHSLESFHYNAMWNFTNITYT